ncbi:MAG: hypothetical protein GAK28_00557 [Luteibacter sp.]|uniref:hypothetical protein n=1 Tax=Luteibacter sp. TaxID=1886636 RepID=UPI00137D9E1B|nr:hypothetical protein [Luteibacter sp.]KAF1008925.1 MAG: hypothetical protein GAK28_00557 [Luteibacter sp.]
MEPHYLEESTAPYIMEVRWTDPLLAVAILRYRSAFALVEVMDAARMPIGTTLRGTLRYRGKSLVELVRERRAVTLIVEAVQMSVQEAGDLVRLIQSASVPGMMPDDCPLANR